MRVSTEPQTEKLRKKFKEGINRNTMFAENLPPEKLSYLRRQVSIFPARVDSRPTPSRGQALRGNDKQKVQTG
jgi:hypothetical protein